MVPSTAHSITSIGFIGSGQLAERIARKLVKNVSPKQKFCYKTQQLVSTLKASDPVKERRNVFQRLGFQTTDNNHDIIADCDLVFLGTTARQALSDHSLKSMRKIFRKETLFVSLMGDLPAKNIEKFLRPGAKVIRMMPQNYLESKGLRVDKLPAKAWATTRNAYATAEDVQRVMEIAGITTCIEGTEQEADLLALNSHELSSSTNDVKDSLSEASSFQDEYILGEFLGRGQFAEVFKATHRISGKVYAVKCVKDEDLSSEGRNSLMAEVSALKNIHHPNIIAHHGFYMEDDKYYLVLDYCNGGSLRHWLDQGRVPEVKVKGLIKQLLQGIERCHSLGYVHRDIKAENVLLVSNALQPQIKLADFGLSKELDHSTGYLQDRCGTPQYLSPEIVLGRTYGKPCDIWSAGILTYMLLSGRIPFDDAIDEVHLQQLIRLGAVLYHYPEWKKISEDAKDFVQCMLDVAPDSRATASELLAHQWLTT